MNRREVLKMLSLSPVIPVAIGLPATNMGSTKHVCNVCGDPHFAASVRLFEMVSADSRDKAYDILGRYWIHSDARLCTQDTAYPELISAKPLLYTHDIDKADENKPPTVLSYEKHPLYRAHPWQGLLLGTNPDNLASMWYTVNGEINTSFEHRSTAMLASFCPICREHANVHVHQRFMEIHPSIDMLGRLEKKYQLFGITFSHNMPDNVLRHCYCDIREKHDHTGDGEMTTVQHRTFPDKLPLPYSRRKGSTV